MSNLNVEVMPSHLDQDFYLFEVFYVPDYHVHQQKEDLFKPFSVYANHLRDVSLYAWVEFQSCVATSVLQSEDLDELGLGILQVEPRFVVRLKDDVVHALSEAL
jgi:hypothetical protein